MLNYSPSLDATFHCLSDPTRRAIVERLAMGSASVKTLAAPFPISLPAVMLHLQVLEAGGLITSKKEGRVRTCELNREPILQAEEWMRNRKATWTELFDRLENLLDGDDERQ
ncbi:transcriptional regulator [Capsulimonas corticalis]|uniref:Transcriptional regulator n=1 Tax=Capsulimonas corticalis TaxID=2219043 RepID=A0A402CXU7_9BACT|nr:metalloregulator ArsR/SmtB family transcription factor [Capsulimonas corticalis]BDI32156.1 transcriptional regulator [Capsulimonas corticalis]